MFLKPSSAPLRSVVSSGGASSHGVSVRRVWSPMAARHRVGGRRACPRRSRRSCRLRNGSVPPCLPHTPLDVYTDLKTQTLIMIWAKYSILKISTLCFCRVFNVHWNSPQMQLLSKLRENCTLFVGNFTKSCSPFQQCPRGMRAVITAHLYLSSFVAMACKRLTEGTGDSKQET